MSDLIDKLSQFGNRRSHKISPNKYRSFSPIPEIDSQGKDPEQDICFLLNMIEQLQGDLTKANGEIVDLRCELEDQKLKGMRGQYDLNEQLDRTNKQLLSEISLLRSTLQDIQHKYQDSQREHDNLKANANELLKQNEGLYQVLNQLKEKHSFELDQQRAQISRKSEDDYNQLRKQLKKEIDSLNSIIDQYKKKNDVLIQENELRSVKNQQLLEQQSKDRLEIEILNTKIPKIAELEQEIIKVESQLQQRIKLVQQLITENNNIGEELQHVRSQLQISQQQYNTLHQTAELEKSELLKQINSLQIKLDQIHHANAEFKKQELDTHKLVRQIQDLGQQNFKLLEQNTYILDKSQDIEVLRANYNQLINKYNQQSIENYNIVQQLQHFATASQILQSQLQTIIVEKNELLTNLHYTQQQLLLLQQRYCSI